MKRKLLAILLTAAMVITAIPAVFVTVTANAVFEPKSDVWFADNGYTAITTQEELKAATMGTAPDAIAKYYLKNDITVAADTKDALMGDLKYIELDGNGHTVKNIQAVNTATGGWPKIAGLSKRVYGYVTVKNLNISGSVTSTVETQNGVEMGGLFGTVNGGFVVVDNVHASMTVTCGTNCRAGGLIGYIAVTGNSGTNPTGTESADTDVTLTNCTFIGDITGGGTQIGGLIGSTNTKNLTVTDCEYLGTINATGGVSEPHIGGIIGYCNAKGAVSITRTVNDSDITEVNTTGKGWARVGGFIGAVANSSYDLDIVDCKSYGTFSGSNDIAGFVGAWYLNDADGSSFVNCENYATRSTGGFAGYVGYTNGGHVYLKDCVNYADILSSGQVGGFIRNCKTSVTLDGCVNYGTMESSNHNDVGGFVASVPKGSSGKLTMNRCVNFGTLQTHRESGWQRLAGMVGNVCDTTEEATCLDIELNYCSNLGHINGESLGVQGVYGDMIGGFKAKGQTVVLNNCYGAGNITVNNANLEYVNCMVGQVGDGLTINNCVSAYKLVPESALTETQEGCIAMDVSSNPVTVAQTLNSGLEESNEAFVVDEGVLEPVYLLNKPATQVYAIQEAMAGEGDTVDVRIVALVNSSNYDCAGVELYKDGESTPAITQTTYTVYSSIANGGSIEGAPFGTFYLPITLKSISVEGTYTVTVKTFVETDGEKQYSDAYTVVITEGEVVSAVKN